MNIKLNDSYISEFVAKKDIDAMQGEVCAALDKVIDGSGAGNDFLGWRDLPENYDREEFARIKLASEKIRKNSDVLVVIGIGGSYLGARAAIEFVRGNMYNTTEKDSPEIYFAGNSISAPALEAILNICKEKDFSINIISKSGTTTEPAIAFRMFLELAKEKYGDEAKERIFATTDKARGTLKSFADNEGWETFVVPDDVGGRFSVLTAVGLLPIAVAGIDIDELMTGAQNARREYLNVSEYNDCLKYAAYRNFLLRAGKTTEILVSYEPSLSMLAEWWKQLYGESEGKDKKGIYPSSVTFSTDLHSLGQYIQDGQRMLFETVIDLHQSGSSLCVPHDEANIDGLNFLAGKSFNEVNRTAMLATILAHTDGGVPNLVIEAEDRSAKTLGELIYFFELACAVSGYVLGVNPFDQPGVEAYKKNMFILLGKPGYEDLREELINRMK
ncbi:MAG: glucose-6-phosphate isomerase [Clostridia bacterium]|nr:glucose-6-phosphate isomerase [Clostridia bacterium]